MPILIVQLRINIILGQIERALKIVPKALSELYESGAINFAVANIFGKAQRYKEAEVHFLKAIKLLGKKADAIHYANLGKKCQSNPTTFLLLQTLRCCLSANEARNVFTIFKIQRQLSILYEYFTTDIVKLIFQLNLATNLHKVL